MQYKNTITKNEINHVAWFDSAEQLLARQSHHVLTCVLLAKLSCGARRQDRYRAAKLVLCCIVPAEKERKGT
jgi:hypothetical protein